MTEELTEDQRFYLVYKQSEDSFLEALPKTEGKVIDHIEAWKNYGFQGTNIYRAYELIKEAIDNRPNSKIILAFTSNAASGGVRDLIAKLCQLKLVDGLVFTAGALEEDFLKSSHNFSIYQDRKIACEVQDNKLRNSGLNRTENLLVPNKAYIHLEKELTTIFNENFNETTNVEPIALAKQLALRANESSLIYWANKNDIAMFPLCVEDSAIGDFLMFQYYRRKKKNKALSLDALSTLKEYYERFVLTDEPVCLIVLGGGTPKHYAINPFIATGGVASAIYINNGVAFDGSNGSASTYEALTWGKIKSDNKAIKVHGDFNIIFPLIASQLIKDEETSPTN